MKLAAPLLAATISVTACASTSQTEQAGGAYDPFEGWNRGVYAFNETVDKAALEPSARAYRAFTPGFFREGVRNFLSNLRQPVVFANTVLQGNADASTATAGRFLINSTVGVAGVFDVASTLGMEKHNEDFGQTLGVWGVGEGAYLMLPLMGPTNVRDAFGMGVDNVFDPLTWTEFENGDRAFDGMSIDWDDTDDQIAVGRTVFGVLSTREQLIETIETLREQPEPYIALRRNYTSQRRAAIRNGEIEEDPYKDLPDFDDFGDVEDESGPAPDQESE